MPESLEELELEELEFEELESELEEFEEPAELPELLAGVGVLVAAEEDEAFLSDEAPEVTDACVEPGSTATTTPAATTEAKDTVIVVVFRRRLPCSRSATARAIWRAAAELACRRARARSRSLPVGSFQVLLMTLSLPRAPVPILGEQSQQAMKL